MVRNFVASPLAAVLTLSMALAQSARAEETLPAADTWIPRQAVIALRVAKPDAILDQVLRPALVDAVKASPAFRAQTETPGFRQVLNLVQFIERRLETDWQKALRRFVGGGAIWAVGPGEAQLLIVDALDAAVLKELHDVLLLLVQMDAANRKAQNGVRSTKIGDVTVWSVGPQEAHAIVGRRLVIANRMEVLKVVLDLRAGAGGESLGSVPAYRDAVKAAGAEAAAVLYADAAVLKRLPQVAQALESNREPLVSLLAAPVLDALGRSSWLALALKVGDDSFTVDAISDGTIDPAGAARFALPGAGGAGALPNLAVPRRIAAISATRDLRGFYAAKDKLFPDRTSGLIFFENMMGIFFTGRELTEEVLAETGSTVRLVVAEQSYDPAVGTPAVRIPAFALVLQLKKPERFRPVVEEAWQKAIGLVNFTRGQEAQPGLIIDRPVHGKTKYTVASFTPESGGDKKAVDVRFNFQPTLAMPGSSLIFSSTEALARDLIDALGREPDAPPPRAGTHSLLEIDGPQLVSILAANRETLIRNDMVDKGKSREESAAGVDLILGVARYIQRLALALGAEAGRSTISLQVRFGSVAR